MKLAQTLTPDIENKTVYMVKSAFGKVEIKQSDEESWLLVDDVVQTAISNAPPYRSLLPHNYVMLLPLNLDSEPSSLLELGGGGMFVNRYLSCSRPNINVTSIECAIDIIDAVNRLFPESKSLDVREADAWQYLTHCYMTNKTYDWILVDLFIGSETSLASSVHIPSAESSIESNFELLHKVLNPSGWLIINVLDTSAENISFINQQIETYFNQTAFRFAVPSMQNQVFLLKKGCQFTMPESIECHDLNRPQSQ